jgi:membrane-bound lytic murein transglycosylase F
MRNKMLRFWAYLIIVFTFLIACNSGSSNKVKPRFATAPLIKRDLAEIKASGELRAIAIYNSTSYFLYRGQAMGFEYDLLSRLAKELGVSLKIIVADNIDELFDMLNRGDGDIAAYGLTVTEGRKQFVSFTEHHYVTHQVLVQRKPKNWRRLARYKIDRQLIKDPLQLIEDTVYIRKNSSYADRIASLSDEIGGIIHVEHLDGALTTDEIIEKVVNGEIKYTVADHNIAELNATYHPILDVSTALSFSQRIAWAVRKNSPQLLKEINNWIVPLKKTDFYWATYNKYFKHKKTYARRLKSPFFSKKSGQISEYDSTIKMYADSLKWDWRLLSSVIYQESKFEADANSWAGAVGLMQILPSTGAEFVKNTSRLEDPVTNIQAGTAYLKQIFDKWEHIEDSVQRIKFTLASYNCGYGHLLDAQRLAARSEKDSLIYDDNVELFLLELSKREIYSKPFVRYGYVRGTEPYRYVRQIFARFERYRQFVPDEPIDSTLVAIQ